MSKAKRLSSIVIDPDDMEMIVVNPTSTEDENCFCGEIVKIGKFVPDMFSIGDMVEFYWDSDEVESINGVEIAIIGESQAYLISD